MQLGRSDRVVTDLRCVFRCIGKQGIRHTPVLRRPSRSPSRLVTQPIGSLHFACMLPAKRLVNPRNLAANIRKLQMPCYSVAVNFSATPNGYPGEDIGGWTKLGMKLSAKRENK